MLPHHRTTDKDRRLYEIIKEEYAELKENRNKQNLKSNTICFLLGVHIRNIWERF